jgi:hypothetical protein
MGSAKGFSTTPRTRSQISIYEFYLILIGKNDSIINRFHTLASNNLKPKLVHSYSLRALESNKELNTWFGRSHCDKQNQTNYLAS